MTAAQMRKLAMALPGVIEKSHFGKPDFRVKGRIFAGLSQDGTQGNLKLRPATQEMVIDAKPDVFSPAAGAWGRSGWTLVKLSGTKAAELGLLLTEAHELVARKK